VSSSTDRDRGRPNGGTDEVAGPVAPRGILRGLRRGAIPFGVRLGTYHHYRARALATSVGAVAATGDAGPSIAIVTPSYQQGAYLERTIRSVIEQEYPRLEYVVQDGGSTDGSVAIIERYADRLAAWSSGPDDGQADAVTVGLARTSGEIMAWLNSDDLLLPGTLAYVAAYFRDHPDVDVIYGHRVVINPQGLEIGRWVLPTHRASAICWVDYIPQETMFWRRSIWEAVGGLDTSFGFALDWELIVRFAEAGARFVRVPRFLGAFTAHPAQKSQAARADLGEREIRRIRAKIAGTPLRRWWCRARSVGYLMRSVLYYWAYRLRIAHYS